MAQPTLTNIYDYVRSKLADDRVAGGEVYTDSILLSHAQSAVRALWRGLRWLQHPRIDRTVYHVLAANTSVLVPSSISITDLVEPISCEEREAGTAKTVTGATQQTGPDRLRITATSHGFATGDMITLGGLGGIRGADGMWAITQVDANTFDANGCVITGTYTSGGSAVKSTEEFGTMWRTDRIDGAQRSAKNLSQWAWRENRYEFYASPEARQLRLIFESSATVPTTGSDVIAVDDSLDFLGTLTAAFASEIILPSASARLKAEALGPTQQQDGSGGLLRDLISVSARAFQNRPPEERQRRDFREHAFEELDYLDYL